MKNKYIILLSAISMIAAGQDTTANSKKSYKYNNLFDLGLSVGSAQLAPTFAWNHLHGIGKKKNLKIGYGVRWSSFIGLEDKDYTTAPAKLTSGVEGPQAMFTDNIVKNIDTISIKNPYVGMANIYVAFQYTFFKKLDLGFNIDVVGFSYGSKVQSLYTQNSLAPATTETSYLAAQDASPTTLNLLLVSDNDIGGLNSEFFVRYWFNDKWAIKGMFTFMFTEFTTTNKLRLENDRFRNKATLFGLGVTYCPWK